jgi:2-polyprenyl-3-methyl-5-hydroxy-6-metoxy-1,4-benzoquinol methylase
MMDLAHRHDIAEMMDAPDTPPADYAAALRDLAAVNRVTRTHAPILAWLSRATRGWPQGSAVSVLDVASGHGDLLRAIHAWATRAGFTPVLSGVDLNPRSAVEAAAHTAPGVTIAWHTADVFAFTPAPKPDFIVSSQFAHHLSDDEIVAFLQWLERHAARGWLVADIHRHVIPYYGFRILCRIFFWHRIVRIDGTISVARSLTPAEWRGLLARAGLEARVRWHALFRLTIGRLKP